MLTQNALAHRETTGRFRNIFLKDVVEPYSNIPYDGSDGLF